MSNRYSRQERFRGIGVQGQEKLRDSRVAIVGLGALGSVSANELARAGVGYLRLIDRDYVELSNLQRQVLYDEHDVKEGTPKAIAASEHIRRINSEIVTEPVLEDFNAGNAAALLKDIDLVLDATDNFETRYLINEACTEYGIPWIYGAALESYGMTMNILPGGPCFTCFTEQTGAESFDGTCETCSSVGVLNAITAVIASYQSSEAIKILVGSDDVCRQLRVIDMWDNHYDSITVMKNENCPVCVNKEHHYLGKVSGIQTDKLCGRDSIQIVPPEKRRVDFDELTGRLSPLGTVSVNTFSLDFDSTTASFKLFRDGRAIIRNVTNPGRAKSVYAEYIGF
ncbi:MAG: ThiF family adenylyltransferase [Bacillota bacterium]|nr:ThiF family adenylyltransferase [Bacillota bacterium]